MTEYKAQDTDIVFALDIGTRSVVGIVGTPVGDRLKVLGIEMEEHKNRAMMDGQIDNIQQVADSKRNLRTGVVRQPAHCCGADQPAGNRRGLCGRGGTADG